MSNGDHHFKHAVVRIEEFGDLKVLCFTEVGQPAVYHDPVHAELRAEILREVHPGYRFKVLDFEVL